MEAQKVLSTTEMARERLVMRKRSIISFLLLGEILIGASACSAASSQATYGPYRGLIVDAETNKPIAGAAVLAVWWEAVFNPVQGRQEFYDAKEAVTGADGRFEIAKLDVPPWKLGVQPGQLYFFTPGYLPLEDIVTPPGGEVFVAPTVTKMRKLIQAELSKKSRSRPGGVPLEKMTEFTRAINQERKMLGMPPIPIVSDERRQP
jgi:hypothetical protein